VGQQPAHHAIWIREKPDGAPPATACSAWPDRTPAARHPRTVPSRVLQSVRDSGQAVRVRTHHPPGAIPRVACKRMPAVSPESTGSACYGG
jgi:hypothetical protein